MTVWLWLVQAFPMAAVLSVVVGAPVSMRIWLAAVLTASALPTVSTEKYLIVYTLSVVSEIVVPVAEAVVGVDPSVV